MTLSVKSMIKTMVVAAALVASTEAGRHGRHLKDCPSQIDVPETPANTPAPPAGKNPAPPAVTPVVPPTPDNTPAVPGKGKPTPPEPVTPGSDKPTPVVPTSPPNQPAVPGKGKPTPETPASPPDVPGSKNSAPPSTPTTPATTPKTPDDDDSEDPEEPETPAYTPATPGKTPATPAATPSVPPTPDNTPAVPGKGKPTPPEPVTPGSDKPTPVVPTSPPNQPAVPGKGKPTPPEPVTPGATPVTPSATPVTPSATPATPSATPATPSATPVTPCPSSSTPSKTVPPSAGTPPPGGDTPVQRPTPVPSTETPAPSTPAKTPEPSKTPAPSTPAKTPEPSKTPAPSTPAKTPEPSKTPAPSKTPEPSKTPAPTTPVVVPPGDLVKFDCGPLEDGKISKCSISVTPGWGGSNPPFDVEIKIPGVTCEKTKFSFEQNSKPTDSQSFYCKPDGCAPEGTTKVDASLHFSSSSTATFKDAKQSIVHKHSPCGSGQALGDPHYKTLDGKKYDFHTPGVYTILSAGALKVQGFQDHCVLNRQVSDLGCYRGMAVAFGDAVVRVHMDEQKKNIVVAKGSDDYATWLDVEKLQGNADGYRVFTKVDQLTYVDITTEDYLGDRYLNMAFQVSPYFRSKSVTGMLGNWNGVQEADEVNTGVLTKKYSVDMKNNLMTCTNCGSLTTPAMADDSLALKLAPSTKGSKFFEGFATYQVSQAKTYMPVVTSKKLRRTQALEGREDVSAEAKELCAAAIESVPHCDQYVEDVSYYVDSYCYGDAVATGDLGVVDSAKVAYMRECRREIDTKLQASTNSLSEAEVATIEKHRADLSFGDITKCPNACGGNGDCLASGCKCAAGFTGYACEISI